MALFTQPLNTKWRYGFEYASTLGAATISSSTWASSPASGIALTGSANDADSTSVLAEVTSAGTYVLTNSIVASDGTTDKQSHILVVEAVPDGSYLGPEQAQVRLAAYGVDARPPQGDLVAASLELEALAPFVGAKQDSEQERVFPRSINPDGTENESTDPPEAVLDWVALKAYTLANVDTPAITAESIGSTSRSYSTPKVDQSQRRMSVLIQPYLLKVGQRLTGGSSWRTWESYPDAPLDIWR